TVTKNKKNHNELCLSKKMEVIEYLKNHSQRQCSAQFHIAKGTVSNIFRKRDTILKRYEGESAPNKRKRILKSYESEINEYTWEFFQRARVSELKISGPILQNAAVQFAKHLKQDNFNASNGWLESFKHRHKINFSNMNLESASTEVRGAELKLKIPEILQEQGYSSRDVFNVDETTLFYRALPKASSIEKYQQAGQNDSNERLTILLAVNMNGEVLKPLVIGKCFKPKCFGNVDSNDLPVTWKANNKAQMVYSIFEEWLNNLNDTLINDNRNIIIFLNDLFNYTNNELSNIKLVFIPPTSSSFMQPLDQGIIQNFKVLYRSSFIKRVISDMELDTKHDIDLMDAIYWVSKAAKDINPTIIKKCFYKSGFLDDIESQELMDIDTDYLNSSIINSDVLGHYFVNFENNFRVVHHYKNIEDIINDLIKEFRTVKNDKFKKPDDDNDGDNYDLINYVEANEIIKKLKVFLMEKELNSINEIYTIEDIVIAGSLKHLTKRTRLKHLLKS
ncbi:unnamed protein product, partial [Gordionus sp. m RMFG-2023]